MVNTKKEFRAANASSVRRIEKTQSVTEQRAGSIPPALKQQARKI